MQQRKKPVAKPRVRATNTGKALEQEVFEVLTGMLANRRLGLDPNTSVVRLHPEYYSRKREKEIVFDVSIEATLPGAPTPFLLWVWECKDYRSAIPVKIVEEFHDKLDQIGTDGTKGTVITRGTYQESAIKVAEANKMGLARLLPDAQVDWVVHRMLRSGLRKSVIPETYEALLLPNFSAQNQDLFGFTGNGQTKIGLSLDSFIRLNLEEWGVVNPDRP